MQEREHPTLDELVDYVAASRPEAAPTIGPHLEHCAACRVLKREVDGAGRVWSSWSIRNHAAAYQAQRLAGALEQLVAAAPPAVRGRLERWRDERAGRAGGAVRVVIGSTNEASHLLAEDVEGLLAPGAALRFRTKPVSTLGGVSRRPRRVVRARGALPGAAPAAPRRVAVAPGTPAARVELTGPGEVAVRVELPAGRAPLVVLASLDERVPARIATLEDAGKPPALAARFQGVARGAYVLAFEPTDTTVRPSPPAA